MGLGESIKNLVHRTPKEHNPAREIPTNPSTPAALHPQQYHPAPSSTPINSSSSPVDERVKPEIRERAQQLVQQQNAARTRIPHYEGLPPQYVLEVKMGDGAFSHVYKAYDKLKERYVAIKIVRKLELNHTLDGHNVHPGRRAKPRMNERASILKEVQIMRGIRHESIVDFIAFHEVREYYFLVLELLEGGELFHQIVKLTYFSEDLARHVILQVAHGVRYLHEERGVVHRDIKPENLLFSSIPIIPSKYQKARPYDEEKEDEGEFVLGLGGGGIGAVKIADFGLSKVVWNEETMTPCGTVGYTAPEIVKDERYSKSVDMWALGCVLYTLLCGFPPFYDESIHVLTEKVAKGSYTFLSPWWDDISDASKHLIENLLCVDPEKRFTIDEFLAHPWCNLKPAKPMLNENEVKAIAPHMKRLRTSALPPASLDSPLLQAQHKRTPMKSPGLHSLREAFDITYAVHRMGEESSRRRAYGIGGGARGSLHGLNEVDEEMADEEMEATKRKHGDAVSRVISERTQNNTRVNAGAQGSSRNHQRRAPVQADIAPQSTANFQLNLNGATMLGRRQNATISPTVTTAATAGRST